MPSGRKFVLLALVDSVDEHGICSPSVATLGRMTSLCVRAVQRHLGHLVATGLVQREVRSGRGVTYRLDIRKTCTPAESTAAQALHVDPASVSSLPTNSSSDDRSITHAVWRAYAAEYVARYGVEPVLDNRNIDRCRQLVELMGVDEALQVAVFYVRSNRNWYVLKGHPFRLLVQDAENLRSEAEQKLRQLEKS
jgi:hypothetical protein